MTDPQEAYRRWEGIDSPLEDGGAAFDHKLLKVLFVIVAICGVGLIGISIS